MSRSIGSRLIAELDTEVVATRRLFERIPDEHLSWRPHERSFTLGQLALHIAGIPVGIARLLAPLHADFPEVPYPQPASVDEVLRLLRESVDEARTQLKSWDEADLDAVWTLSSGGTVVIESPRYVMVRSLLLNHLFHHRGQLTVYLRMLDIPLPDIYGPTADEQGG